MFFFTIKIVISFIFGAIFLSLLLYFAEKSNKKISGIIITFPSTMVLSFFFIGWTISSKVVIKIVPLTIIILGLDVFFIIIYPFIASYVKNKIKNKLLQILITLFLSLSVWFILSILFFQYKINNLFVSILIYLFFVVMSKIIISKKIRKIDKKTNRNYAFLQIIFRALFMGFIVALSVFLSKFFDPFLGAIFAVFPAAFVSMIIIIHYNYDSNFLFYFLENVSIGSLNLFFYAIITIYTFKCFGFVFGTLINICFVLLFGFILIKIKNS